MDRLNRKRLTVESMLEEAVEFCIEQSQVEHPQILGVTDGKAVGTYIEHLFQKRLETKYVVEIGNSGRGIDIPDPAINTDIKTTSSRQPQSSTPYRDSAQKIFGLGHNILIFVYQKEDDGLNSWLRFKNCSFIPSHKTGDFTITKEINLIKKNGGGFNEIRTLLVQKNIPGGDIVLDELTEQILRTDVEQGYVTISNALQWRLNYTRPVNLGGQERDIFNYDFE